MNIEILAARLASLVPEIAHDCPTNNAEVIKREILAEINVKRTFEKSAQKLESLRRDLERNSPKNIDEEIARMRENAIAMLNEAYPSQIQQAWTDLSSHP